MFEFYQKRRLKRLLYSKFMAIVLLVPIFGMATAALSAWKKERYTSDILATVRAELAELETREAALHAELDRLKSPRGIEEEIRGKFEMGRAGEEAIVILSDAAPLSTPTPPPPKPWWQWW